MTVNIYLNKKTKEQIDEILKNYKVSLSTFTEKLVKVSTQKPTSDETTTATIQAILNGKLIDGYIDKQDKFKTSIKPRENDISTILEKTQKLEYRTRLYSNLLFAYIYYIDSGIYTKEQHNEIKQRLGNELSKVKEQRWNYNNNIRNTIRVVKHNKEYFRKILNL